MATYVKMDIAVTIAEFPDYQLCQSFSVFNLGKTTSSSSVAGAAALGRGEKRNSFERLAKVFGVSVEALIDEHATYFPIAQDHHFHTGCSFSEAWQHALNISAKSGKILSRPDNRKNDNDVTSSTSVTKNAGAGAINQ